MREHPPLLERLVRSSSPPSAPDMGRPPVLAGDPHFEFRQTRMKHGRLTGHFSATGQIPRCLGRLRAAGIELPMGLFTPQ